MRPMSLSKFNVYKGCPKQYFYKHIEPPVGTTMPESKAMSRGLVIHQELEDRVNLAIVDGMSAFTTPLKSASKLQWYFDELVAQHPYHMVPEQELAINPYTDELVPWDSKGSVVRAKLDFMYMLQDDPGVLYVVDWKTGQIYDKHTEERGWYAVVAYIVAKSHGVEFDKVKAAYAYVDTGSLIPFDFQTFSIGQLEALKISWFTDMISVGTTERFTYTPGNPQCKWCDYAKSKTGVCMFG